jgi:hypothetical protein
VELKRSDATVAGSPACAKSVDGARRNARIFRTLAESAKRLWLRIAIMALASVVALWYGLGIFQGAEPGVETRAGSAVSTPVQLPQSQTTSSTWELVESHRRPTSS